jgi:hypothetical protein
MCVYVCACVNAGNAAWCSSSVALSGSRGVCMCVYVCVNAGMLHGAAVAWP